MEKRPVRFIDLLHVAVAELRRTGATPRDVVVLASIGNDLYDVNRKRDNFAAAWARAKWRNITPAIPQSWHYHREPPKAPATRWGGVTLEEHKPPATRWDSGERS